MGKMWNVNSRKTKGTARGTEHPDDAVGLDPLPGWAANPINNHLSTFT